MTYKNNNTAGKKNYQSIAVVIPTYNRWDCLEATLGALLNQDTLPNEVIVVDDGSMDDTWQKLQAWKKTHSPPFEFLIFTQKNSGSATARNFGVKQAQSDLVAFIGDDTIPSPDWTGQHLNKHNELSGEYAIVGYTGWDSKAMRVTPFLQYINEYGAQFKYSLMPDGGEVPFTCFYTSNISLPRKQMLAEPFNEIFRSYGWEDAETGYRLSKNGVRLIYHKAAKTRHRHQTTVATFMKRQFMVGSACHILLNLHPELTDKFYYKNTLLIRLYIIMGYVALPFLQLIRMLDYLYIPLPHTVYLFFLGWYYIRGLREGDEP